LGWLAWLVLTAGSGALVGPCFSGSRASWRSGQRGLVLLATLLFGAGVGYAAELSPFLVCALAVAVIVSASPRRHAVRRVLADWEPLIYAIFLVTVGHCSRCRRCGSWSRSGVGGRARRGQMGCAAVRSVALRLDGCARNAGLGTVAQAASQSRWVEFRHRLWGRGAGSGGALLRRSCSAWRRPNSPVLR